jgi:hypothetical protein
MGNLAGTGQALDGSLNTIFSEFKLLRDETGVFRSVATRMDLKPHEGRSKNVNNYNRVTALDLADGVDMQQAQQLADTTTTFTPAEVGVQVLLPGSTMRRVADPDLLRRTGRMLNNAYDLKEDQDGALQMVNWTPTMGVANSVIGPGEYYGAMTRLMIGNNRSNPEPPPEPYYIVDHPIKLAVVAGNLIPFTDVPTGTNRYTGATITTARTIGSGANTGGQSSEIIKEHIGALGRMFGATVKKSANIPVDGSDDASGGAFSKEGLIYVSEVEPRTDNDTSDKSLRGAVELNLWGSYVWGLYRAGAYGVEIIGDATLPAAS